MDPSSWERHTYILKFKNKIKLKKKKKSSTFRKLKKKKMLGKKICAYLEYHEVKSIEAFCNLWNKSKITFP